MLICEFVYVFETVELVNEITRCEPAIDQSELMSILPARTRKPVATMSEFAVMSSHPRGAVANCTPVPSVNVTFAVR